MTLIVLGKKGKEGKAHGLVLYKTRTTELRSSFSNDREKSDLSPGKERNATESDDWGDMGPSQEAKQRRTAQDRLEAYLSGRK